MAGDPASVDGSGSPSFAEACRQLMASFDVFKSSSRFLLRQMVMASSDASRTAAQSGKVAQALKLDLDSTQRKLADINHEAQSAVASLQAKLSAKELEVDSLKQQVSLAVDRAISGRIAEDLFRTRCERLRTLFASDERLSCFAFAAPHEPLFSRVCHRPLLTVASPRFTMARTS